MNKAFLVLRLVHLISGVAVSYVSPKQEKKERGCFFADLIIMTIKISLNMF